MADHAIEHTTPRIGSIDRYSPAVLLSLAFAFGVLAQYLFYRSALGINVGIASVVIVAVAWRLRPAGARVDRLDRWIVLAAVSFAGVPLTRRALDVLVILGLVVVGRIVAGGALLLAALPDLGRPLARRGGGRIASVGVGIALAFPFLIIFAVLFASADAVFSSAITNVFDLRKWSIGELIGRLLLAAIFAWVAGG